MLLLLLGTVAVHSTKIKIKTKYLRKLSRLPKMDAWKCTGKGCIFTKVSDRDLPTLDLSNFICRDHRFAVWQADSDADDMVEIANSGLKFGSITEKREKKDKEEAEVAELNYKLRIARTANRVNKRRHRAAALGIEITKECILDVTRMMEPWGSFHNFFEEIWAKADEIAKPKLKALLVKVKERNELLEKASRIIKASKFLSGKDKIRLANQFDRIRGRFEGLRSIFIDVLQQKKKRFGEEVIKQQRELNQLLKELNALSDFHTDI